MNRILKLCLPLLGLASLLLMAPHATGANKTESNCHSCHDRLEVPHTGATTAHSALDCAECHRHPLSAEFHSGKKTVADVEKKLASIETGEIHLSETEVLSVHRQCQSCHEAEFKDWTASKHTFNFGQSFLNSTHNRMEQPINDCLRCHAMFFDGEIGDLVTPLNNKGPWKMKSSKWAKNISIPCLTCHQVHPGEGAPALLPRYAAQRSAPEKGSLATGFYDRREKTFFPLNELPHPQINDGQNSIKISNDPRIRICYQCHAPNATHITGSSDDMTPRGVHAGLSCMDCHGVHALSTRNSCAQCHPANSHCKLDVITMDTTTHSKTSGHDIHRVACVDCHHNGVPKR